MLIDDSPSENAWGEQKLVDVVVDLDRVLGRRNAEHTAQDTGR